MPASLCEAFAASTICGSGTESLHNPRYKPEVSGQYIQQTAGQLGPGQQRQLQPQQQAQICTQGQDKITLDDETKCDLHIYHILSCQTCREKLRGILGSSLQPQQQLQQQQLQQQQQLTPNYNNRNLMNITIDDLRSLLTSNAPSNTGNIEKLILYIVLAIFVVYLIDIYMRK